MQCDCGAEMVANRETYHYLECGLPRVWLDGAEVRRCASCGEEELVVPRLAELHRVLARAVLAKPGRLTGVEVRFLRKSVGWSATDLARYIGVTKHAVSRWENDKEPIGLQSDRLLRMLVTQAEPIQDYGIENVAAVRGDDEPPLDLHMRLGGGQWRPKDAVA